MEADNLDQVRALLEVPGVEVILLDNMRGTEMREAVAIGKGKVKFEASGGINLRNVRQIAATGVDFVSIGALTHSAPSIADRLFSLIEADSCSLDRERSSDNGGVIG